MDRTHWQLLRDRLDQAHQAMIGSRVSPGDLWRMDRTVRDLLSRADSEWVRCRHLRHPSARYDDLLAQTDQALRNFEAYTLMARLMHKETK